MSLFPTFAIFVNAVFGFVAIDFGTCETRKDSYDVLIRYSNGLGLIKGDGTSAFSDDKVINFVGHTKWVEEFSVDVISVAKNMLPGCRKLIFEDGHPAYISKTKSDKIETNLSDDHFDFEIKTKDQGFCWFRPEALVLELKDELQKSARLAITTKKRKDPMSNEFITWVPLREVREIECVKKISGDDYFYACAMIDLNGRRFELGLDNNNHLTSSFVNLKTDIKTLVIDITLKGE